MIQQILFTLATLLGLAKAADPQTKFVSVGGSDTAGDGSYVKPFLTIQAAITSITDASSAKPYRIAVGPGVFASNFVLQPWIFVEGAGALVTRVTNAAANWIGAGFAAAAQQDCGIEACTFSADVVVNFATVASPGAGRFLLTNCSFDACSFNVTGNNAANAFFAKDIQRQNPGGSTFVITNIITDFANVVIRTSNVTYTNNSAYSISSRWGNVKIFNVLTLVAPVSAQFLQLTAGNLSVGANSGTGLVLTGDGVLLSAPGLFYNISGPDADTVFTDSNTVGATRLVSGGYNVIDPQISVNRTYTLLTGNPTGRPTVVRVKNRTSVVLSLLFGGTTEPLNTSWVPPGAAVDAVFSAAGWETNMVAQSGTIQLVNGVSPFIPADISTTVSAIFATLKIRNGVSNGCIQAKDTDRVSGFRATGGGFKLTSIDPATGATVVTDLGTYDWHVDGGF